MWRVQLSTKSNLATSELMNQHSVSNSFEGSDLLPAHSPSQTARRNPEPSLFLVGRQSSPWSRSRAKRIFDCICVISTLPVLIPVLLAVAVAVRLTSSGPVLFLQKRMSRQGLEFTIFKFRTMTHTSGNAHHPVTTSGNQRLTPVGPFLRRWKLDELPQLFNVLAGHMSLVGPRPKLPQHTVSGLCCRAGITGAATLAFAREEAILERVPVQHLQAFYHSAVLPAKHHIDAEYMAKASFLSDLKIIFDTVFRRWDTSIMESILTTWAFEPESGPTAMDEMNSAGLHASTLLLISRHSQGASERRLEFSTD
jgi:lipopolysaccharide/colanic/teichoic acid biosynthesis glycosyltransferase